MPSPGRCPRSAPSPMNCRSRHRASGDWQTHPEEERGMALVPLATKGNYFHVYDFRVKPGRGDEFVDLFNKFDYGDNNPFHRPRAQVKDGVLCRDATGPDHFYLAKGFTLDIPRVAARTG